MTPALTKHVERWFPRAKTLVDAGLVASLGWLLAGLIWMGLEPVGAVTATVPLAPYVKPDAAVAAVPAANLSVLTRFSRFGRSDAPQTFAPNAPPTNLDLILKGVRTAPDDENADRLHRAIAMIEVPGGEIKTVRPGETIIERVTLNTVLADRVLIMKDGELETLLMESSAGQLAVLSLPGQDGLVTGKPSSENMAGTPATVSAPRSAGASGARDVSPRAMMTALDISPVVQEGVTVGYRLDAGIAAPLLAQSGLSTNDIVTAINGMSVTDANPEQIMAQLKSSSSASLTILRDGVSQSVTLTLPIGAN